MNLNKRMDPRYIPPIPDDYVLYTICHGRNANESVETLMNEHKVSLEDIFVGSYIPNDGYNRKTEYVCIKIEHKQIVQDMIDFIEATLKFFKEKN